MARLPCRTRGEGIFGDLPPPPKGQVTPKKPHLAIEAAEGLHEEGGPAHVQDGRGAPLLPPADAVVEAQQVSEALGVLQGWETPGGPLCTPESEGHPQKSGGRPHKREQGAACRWGPPKSHPCRCGGNPWLPHGHIPPPFPHPGQGSPTQGPPPPPNPGVPNSRSHLSPRGGLGRRLLEQVGDDVIGHVKEFLVDLLILPAVIVAGGGRGGLGGPLKERTEPTKGGGTPRSRPWVWGGGAHAAPKPQRG